MRIKTIVTTITAIFLLLLVIAWACAQDAATPATPEATLARVLAKAEETTGITRRHEVPAKRMSRQAVRQLLVRELDQEKSPERFSREERLLKTLGMIPASLKLRDFLIELYTEQVGGFYDPRSRSFVVVDGMGEALQELVMAHELVHAIQDQHAGFARLMKSLRGKDDAELAFSAVVEGCATTAMLAYMLGGSVDKMAAGLDKVSAMMRMGNDLFSAQMPAYAQAPPYIQESLLFPYAYGADFILYFLKSHHFPETNNLFCHPPSTSEQILHPDKFFRSTPEPPLPTAWEATERKLIANAAEHWVNQGEFFLREFLSGGLPRDEAEKAAAEWGGDRLVVLNGPEGKAIVVWKIRWDTTAAAKRFTEALARWKGKEGRPVPRLLTTLGDTVVISIGT